MDAHEEQPRSEPTTPEQMLRQYLATTDAACPVCAYDLRGLTSSKCPECGAALELQIGSHDLRLWPWLVALLSFALPLGFSLVMFAIMLIFVLTVALSDAVQLVGLGCGLVLFGSGFLIVLRKRRAFATRRLRTQIIWAKASVAIALLMLAFELFLLFRFA